MQKGRKKKEMGRFTIDETLIKIGGEREKSDGFESR